MSYKCRDQGMTCETLDALAGEVDPNLAIVQAVGISQTNFPVNTAAAANTSDMSQLRTCPNSRGTPSPDTYKQHAGPKFLARTVVVPL